MCRKLEEMSAFFNARVDGYEEHQRTCIDGGEACYREVSRHIPAGTRVLLDLGCGTGLELDYIFPDFPGLEVTGIDVADKMLERLSEKFPDRNLHLVNGSYFDVEFGCRAFDVVLSVMSLHHFTHEEKLGLYRRVLRSLRPGGVYIEADYMISSNDWRLEEFFFSERERLRSEQGMADEFCHCDVPCTVDNQKRLLKKAGFLRVDERWSVGNSVVLVAGKPFF